jgi:hypothetical protein
MVGVGIVCPKGEDGSMTGGLLRGNSDIEETDEGTLRGDGEDGRVKPCKVKDGVGLDELVDGSVKGREVGAEWIGRSEVKGR